MPSPKSKAEFEVPRSLPADYFWDEVFTVIAEISVRVAFNLN